MYQKSILRLKQALNVFQLTIRWYKELASSNSIIKRGLSLVVLGMITFLSIWVGFQIINPRILTDWIHLKLTLTDMGFSGALTYLLMVTILPLFSPIALVIVTGSAAFGPFKCFFLSYIGCLINANITFFLVRALSVQKEWGNGRRSIQVIKTFQRFLFERRYISTSFPFLCKCVGKKRK